MPLTVLVPNADEAERQQLPGAGARVRLSWAPEHMHLVAASGDAPDRGPAERGTRSRYGRTPGMSRDERGERSEQSSDWDIERALDAMQAPA